MAASEHAGIHSYCATVAASIPRSLTRSVVDASPSATLGYDAGAALDSLCAVKRRSATLRARTTQAMALHWLYATQSSEACAASASQTRSISVALQSGNDKR